VYYGFYAVPSGLVRLSLAVQHQYGTLLSSFTARDSRLSCTRRYPWLIRCGLLRDILVPSMCVEMLLCIHLSLCENNYSIVIAGYLAQALNHLDIVDSKRSIGTLLFHLLSPRPLHVARVSRGLLKWNLQDLR